MPMNCCIWMDAGVCHLHCCFLWMQQGCEISWIRLRLLLCPQTDLLCHLYQRWSRNCVIVKCLRPLQIARLSCCPCDNAWPVVPASAVWKSQVCTEYMAWSLERIIFSGCFSPRREVYVKPSLYIGWVLVQSSLAWCWSIPGSAFSIVSPVFSKSCWGTYWRWNKTEFDVFRPSHSCPSGWGTAKMQVTVCSRSHLQSGLSQEPCLYIAKVLTLNSAGGAGIEWIKHTLVAKQQDCHYEKACVTPGSQADSTKRPLLPPALRLWVQKGLSSQALRLHWKAVGGQSWTGFFIFLGLKEIKCF